MSTKVKFLIYIFFIMILLLTIGEIVSLAKTEVSIEGTFNFQDLNVNDNVFIEIGIKDLEDIGEGINAYILTIDFDNNKFEFVEAEGENGWNNPSYKEKNGKIKFVATRTDFSKETGKILKITLKLKENLTYDELKQIKFENISFANKINGNTQKLQIESIKLNISNVNESNNSKQSVEAEKNQKAETGSDKDVDTSKKILPQAGKRSFELFIVILIINSVIFYYKDKKIKL